MSATPDTYQREPGTWEQASSGLGGWLESRFLQVESSCDTFNVGSSGSVKMSSDVIDMFAFIVTQMYKAY